MRAAGPRGSRRATSRTDEGPAAEAVIVDAFPFSAFGSSSDLHAGSAFAGPLLCVCERSIIDRVPENATRRLSWGNIVSPML